MNRHIDIATGVGWVAIRFHQRGPIYVLDDDGTLTTRMTVPVVDDPAHPRASHAPDTCGDVIQLPLDTSDTGDTAA